MCLMGSGGPVLLKRSDEGEQWMEMSLQRSDDARPSRL
jgi:hypothetical protein